MILLHTNLCVDISLQCGPGKGVKNTLEFRENKMKMYKCVFPADFAIYTD